MVLFQVGTHCTQLDRTQWYELLTRADADEINNLRQEKVATRPGGWTGMGKWRHLTLALSTSDLEVGTEH